MLTPTISQRRVKSSIAVTSGQTVLLAGMISETENRQRQGIPILDSIPGMGDATQAAFEVRTPVTPGATVKKPSGGAAVRGSAAIFARSWRRTSGRGETGGTERTSVSRAATSAGDSSSAGVFTGKL